SLQAGISWSPDGARWATISRDQKTILVHDTSGGRTLEWTLPDNDGAYDCPCWSPDGKWIVAGSYNGALFFWDVAQNKPGPILPKARRGPLSPGGTPGGPTPGAAGPGMTRVFRRQKAEPMPNLKMDVKEVTQVAWSKDGKWLAAAGDDHTIRLFEMPEG